MKKFININEAFSVEMAESWQASPPVNDEFHLCYEIYFLLEGEVKYFIDDTLYNIRSGDIVIIPPSIIHKTNRIENIDRKRLVIFLDKSYVDEYLGLSPGMLEGLETIRWIQGHQHKDTPVKDLFIQLYSEYSATKNGRAKIDHAMVKAILVQFLIILKRFIETDFGAVQTAHPDRSAIKEDPIIKIVKYINEHYNEDISLDMLSREFHVHPVYISRAFKEKIGFSYLKYLMNVRVRNAVVLLLESGLNITRISERIGFKSCNSFCKAFKAAMKVSPMQYRKMN